MSLVQRHNKEESVAEMQAQGIIERSSRPWTSAVVLVKKKDGTRCFCVDYRAINEVTIKDTYPMPHVDDILNALARTPIGYNGKEYSSI